MRILHIATRHRRGGAERHLRHVVEWESAAGHEVVLAFGELTDPAEFGGLRVHTQPTLRQAVHPAADVRTLRWLRRLIRDGRFDLVHTHQSKAGVLGRLAARGQVPVIAHTVHMPSFGGGYPAVPSAFFRTAERLCSRFTDLYATVGEELRGDYLEAGIGSVDQYTVVRSPIDIDRHLELRTTSTVARAELRSRFGFTGDTPIALAAGSIEPRKRMGLIVEQLAAPLKARELRLIVAGEGAMSNELRRSVSAAGLDDVVCLPGQLPDLCEALAAADVFVHAARTEGVPQVVLQALAAGLPVAATEVEGLAEIPGAPISIAGRDGTGLRERALEALARGRDHSVPPESFDPWRPDAIDRALDSFHRQVAQLAR